MKKIMVYFLKIVNFGTCQRFYNSERHFWGLQLIDSFKFVLIRFDRYSKKKKLHKFYSLYNKKKL